MPQYTLNLVSIDPLQTPPSAISSTLLSPVSSINSTTKQLNDDNARPPCMLPGKRVHTSEMDMEGVKKKVRLASGDIEEKDATKINDVDRKNNNTFVSLYLMLVLKTGLL
jgi:hypothetical protein